jgi:hypothetical protein
MITIDQIRSIALALPGVEERSSYGGRPSWRTKTRMFTWVREAPEALVVWVESIEDKEALIAAAPDRFFTTGHYDRQPIVLVDLDQVELDEATELIVDSWRHRAPKRMVAQFDQSEAAARSEQQR